MSAATRIPVYTADVSNSSVGKGSDEFFHNYSWQTPSLDDMRDFIGEVMEQHPRALITLSLVQMYQREVDDLPTVHVHEPSNKQKRERDR